jgi:putative transposase
MRNHEIPLLPGGCYHIYNHANGFEDLFRNEGNYAYFLKKYAEHIPAVADTFAYCLMPNHIHLMVRIKPQSELPNGGTPKAVSQVFGNLFSAYAQAFNRQQGRKGSLFIPNFKRKQVEDDRYFSNLICYIHQNPVAHGFAVHPAEWPHSSFLSHLSDRPTRLLRDEVLTFFCGREGFLQAHDIAPDDSFLKIVSEW